MKLPTLLFSALLLDTDAFVAKQDSFVFHTDQSQHQHQQRSSPLFADASGGQADDPALQWELFQKHHAKGTWKGIWTTFDYMGDVLDKTIAGVVYEKQVAGNIQQINRIVTDVKRSECDTCFDAELETRDLPVAAYDQETLLSKRVRVASSSLVGGPTLMRSQSMATELALSSSADSRVRVTFQHAPVWEKGVEPGSVPPQGLKLARVMVCREVLQDCEGTQAATEELLHPRPVSPFHWHKKWGGTSWTWGPQTGNRGWAIDEIEDGDDWHGNAPVDVWNLRLPGGLFLQAPRLLTDATVGLCRLAWLPNDETLLRVEAGVSVLEPLSLDDDTLIGFDPPKLVSLRSDVLDNRGDLDGEPLFLRQEGSTDSSSTDSSDAPKSVVKKPTKVDDRIDETSTLETLRDAMNL